MSFDLLVKNVVMQDGKLVCAPRGDMVHRH